MLVPKRIFLGYEVGYRGVDLDGGGGGNGSEEVVGRESGVVGLGECGDLLDVGDTAAETQIWSHVLRSAVLEHVAELPDVVDALSVGNGHGGPLGDAALEDHAVDLDWVLVEQWMELLELSSERDGVHRGEFAVNFEDDIDVFAGAFAHGRDIVYGVGNESFERHALEAVGERIGLDGGPAFSRRLFRRFVEAVRLFAGVMREGKFGFLFRTHEEMEPDFVARVAAEEVPDGGLVSLSFYVPQGDIDGADGAGQSGASEGSHAVHVLPVVLDARGVLADEVFAALLGDGVGGLHVGPAGRLPDAVSAVVGSDADDVMAAGGAVGAADEEGFDLFDFHVSSRRFVLNGVGQALANVSTLVGAV